MILVMFAAIAVTGAYLAVRGLRVRRRGDTPHCARCDYVLTGLVSGGASPPAEPASSPSTDRPRCPECGATLDTSNVVRGERYRRRRTAAVGVALLLLALLPLGAMVAAGWRGVDWYKFRPAGWLIDDVEQRGTARALGELHRRQRVGSLSASHRDRLIELALAEQGKPTLGPLGSGLIDFAGACLDAGQMTDAQRERFFQQMVRLTLRVRPQVAVGDHVPYRVEYTSRGPTGGGWSVRIMTEDVNLAGRKGMFSGSAGLSGVGSGGSSGSSIQAPPTPGRQTLTSRTRVQVFKGPFVGDASAHEPDHERDVTLSGEVDVVERLPDGAITQNDDPALAPALRAALLLQDFKHGPYGLSGQIQVVAALPADVAFDVVARVGDAEFPMGSVTIPAGTTNSGYHVQVQGPEGPGKDVTNVDVILRSNPDAVRRTVDMTGLWKGELVYPNVPVAPGTPLKP
jgi:ribosomal protein L34E